MESFWNLVGSYLRFRNLNYAQFYADNKWLFAIFSLIGLVGLLLLISQTHTQKDGSLVSQEVLKYNTIN